VSGKSTGAAASGAAPGHSGWRCDRSRPVQLRARPDAGGQPRQSGCRVPLRRRGACSLLRAHGWHRHRLFSGSTVGPERGATYTWVAKVFHPYLGFLAGWMILLYYTLRYDHLTIPAGTTRSSLLAPGLGEVISPSWSRAVLECHCHAAPLKGST